MSIDMQHEAEGKVLHVRVSDKLTREDYERLVPEFQKLIEWHGKIRILMKMDHFHGWTAGALWDDIKVAFKHFNDVERIAMVGDKAWEKGMSVFCKPFTTATIRYFEHARIGEAREWIREGVEAEQHVSGVGGPCGR